MTPKDQLFEDIARRQLGVETLEVRNRDSLDFHDVSVSGIRRALEEAFNAGQMIERTRQLTAGDIDQRRGDKY